MMRFFQPNPNAGGMRKLMQEISDAGHRVTVVKEKGLVFKIVIDGQFITMTKSPARELRRWIGYNL